MTSAVGGVICRFLRLHTFKLILLNFDHIHFILKRICNGTATGFIDAGALLGVSAPTLNINSMLKNREIIFFIIYSSLYVIV